jgi:uncharacterized damage-inducible protein DinB
MTAVHDLVRFTAWGNARIIQVCGSLSAEQLATPFTDLYGTPLETLTHMISVEYNYLRLMLGEAVTAQAFESVAAAAVVSQNTAQGYRDLLAHLAEDDLSSTFCMPGLNRSLTMEHGLLQVVTHSTQHRADLASAATRLGMKPPSLDYVQFLMESDS